MRTLIDTADAPLFAIPTVGLPREGMLIEGPQGWGEFSPPDDCGPDALGRWLTAAVEAGTVGWPDPVRGRVPVAVPVPAVDPSAAHDIAARAGCRSADVAVAAHPASLAEDVARVEAVRDALGPGAAIRCVANGGWDVDTAVTAIAALDRAANGLEFVAQPCRDVDELAAVRRRVDVRIAVDQSIRLADGPRTLALADAADVAVLACGPLGGVRRALRLAEACGLPCVVASAGETSVGLAAGLALAGALPELDFACGLATRLVLGGDLVGETRSLAPVDGHLPVAPMPPAPAPELLDRFALRDAARIRWWRDRLRTAWEAR